MQFPEFPLVMGVLNVTPDSFSDGGDYLDVDSAVSRGMQMFEEGADLVDIGGESTRPGAEPVSVGEELERVIPVIRELVKKMPEGKRISIDTMKPEVAREAVGFGVDVINDVSGMRNPDMIDVVVESGAVVCLMHMLGEPRTMQRNPEYVDVVLDVKEYLIGQTEQCLMAGVEREKIWIDPGIGFGKTVEHNLELIRRVNEICESGYPVLIGTSRKSFIGKILGSEQEPTRVEERVIASVLTHVEAWKKGVSLLRVHDVKETWQGLRMAQALRSS